MAVNHPYDPRFNAKLYVPKLTEDERRARATPLENLRGLRFRTATPAAPSPAEDVVPPLETAQVVPAAPSPTEDVVPALVPTQASPAAACLTEAAAPAPTPVQEAPASDYIPTAREILFAEFPELFPFPYQEVNEEVLVEAKSVIGEPYRVGGAWEFPCKNKSDARPRSVERNARSAQSPPFQTFTGISSYGRKKQLQPGNQPEIVNRKRARLPGLILAVP